MATAKSRCPLCDDDGFTTLTAHERHWRRQKNGPDRCTVVAVTFRSPCRCPAGSLWLVLRRHRGEG